MDRRKFIINGSLAGISVTAIAGACNAPEKPVEQTSEVVPVGDFKDEFSLNEVTIDELQQKMTRGELSSRTITEMYLQRIEAIDKGGPVLNSVIEINPDALALADVLDKERRAGSFRGPLHGIPVLIKDNINTADKMMTTAGSMAMEGNVATNDAFIVQKLREAGAVILGKTNLSEWANFRSMRSSSGWSSRGGQTKNPCVLDRSPCGSSSGSAVAVAANLCAVAIGTETDGSVTAPASFCGIVGIKPTVGLWSRSGIIPISSTQDTAGPMARTVKDAAYLLSALIGVDEADSVTRDSKDRGNKDYSSFLTPDALQGKRIGIEKMFLNGNEAVVNLYKQAIEVLKKQGAVIVEVELIKLTMPLNDAEFEVLKYEFKDGVNKYLMSSNAKVKTLAEVIAFNKKNKEKAMPFFKQEILEMCVEKGSLKDKAYLEAVKKSTSTRMIIDDMMKEKKLDAICSTTMGLPNSIDYANGDSDVGFYFARPAAMAGYPHITVPMGQVLDLPIGLSFISGAYKEGEILGFAYAYEQASKKRQAPKFKKTVV